MAGKWDEPEGIVPKLLRVEVLRGQGRSVQEGVRRICAAVQTQDRWPKQSGGMNRDRLKRRKELETENTRPRRAVSGLSLDEMIPAEAARRNFKALPAAGNASTMCGKPSAVVRLGAMGPSPMDDERRVCRTLGPHRSTRRTVPIGLPDEERLTGDIIAPAEGFGRCGYRMITGTPNTSGWHVTHNRVKRIWRREGLEVPRKQPEKGRSWLNDGSRARL